MVYFCKMFTAYKQVRDSTVFLYQITGILLLLSTTIIFWYLSYRFSNRSGVIKWNMLIFMAIVYIGKRSLIVSACTDFIQKIIIGISKRDKIM